MLRVGFRENDNCYTSLQGFCTDIDKEYKHMVRAAGVSLIHGGGSSKLLKLKTTNGNFKRFN